MRAQARGQPDPEPPLGRQAGHYGEFASEEAALPSLQVLCSPSRTKAAVAAVDAHDKIIVVGYFFFLCVT